MTVENHPSIESAEPQKDSPEITITLRRIHLFAVIVPLVFLLGLGIGYLLWGRTLGAAASEVAIASTSPSPQAAAAGQSQVSITESAPKVTRYDVPVDDDPILGPQDAPITIIEFSDYECPFCRKWQSEVLAPLMETYPDQVRLVFRDFPLTSIHANAEPAAEAANCANEQGAFWDYHDKLFSMELGLSPQAYEQYASQLSLDVDAFKECLNSGRFQSEVQADFDYASNLGVRSTPTFFINGIAVVGAQPFEIFQQVIDKELAGEIP